MSDDCNRTPFWQRQPRLPLDIQRFLQARTEAALGDPDARQVLVWPTILGAPALRRAHPDGVPEGELLAHAARMLGSLGHHDPAAAWGAHREAWPTTAEAGPTGWRPAPAWGAWGPLVSLRCGWELAALTPLPLGERYPLACGVSLFNHGLFHECHDALEPLWTDARGELKDGLQGLILLAGGYHHLQQHNLSGMVGLWEEALGRLEPCGGRVSTPWGEVRAEAALDLTARRLDHGRRMDGDADFGPLWALDRPTWELA
ncbi:DUF309 domain-containing protein [Geothrix sp. 21YS21S-4]|uniref:DUF309 domain-containing protein n=1 Tax=Geothrix sp. 21YS21S-4 TaxID=3068889 RepID=UPI0027B9B8F5|nr:DUF309 domain-containing protein [Geothrix sp. 21YS21S-4]